MKKKWLAMVLTGVMAFGLCACGKEAPVTEEAAGQTAEGQTAGGTSHKNIGHSNRHTPHFLSFQRLLKGHDIASK